MGLLALITAFSYSMFYIIQITLRVSDESTGLKIFSVLLFTLAILVYMRQIIKRKKISQWDIIVFFITACFLLSAAITVNQYGYIDTNFGSLILSFGVRGIPAMLMGLTIARTKALKELVKWIQPIMLLYTISIFMVVLANQTGNVMGYKLYGLDRQLVSYYAAFALGMNVFLNVYNDNLKKFRIFKASKWKYINFVALILQIYCVFAGGGRGAFILMLIYIIYYVIYSIRHNRISFSNLSKTIALVLFIIAFIGFIGNDESISSGYGRIITFFSGDEAIQDTSRMILYSSAFNIFKQQPIFGHGIGSVTYEVGFYSHNIFLDLMVDGGLFLLGIFIALLFKFIKCIKKLIKIDGNNNIMLVIFLSAFIMLLFSGSYLSDSGIWFAFSYVFFASSKYRPRFSQN